MKCASFGVWLLLAGVWLAPRGNGAETAEAAKIRVLVATGGHAFEQEAFYRMFKDNPQITFQAVEHPKAHAWLETDAARAWDVLVLYDMYQPITEATKKNLLARLGEGKGLVALHHAIANYQDWSEYWKIVGARYYLKDTVVDGVTKKRSAYKHDMKFKVRIADRQHPVARGMDDFDIHDETYKGFDVLPDGHVLLTTDEPESNPVIGWSRHYDKARVIYLQLGHDHFAYENPNYRKLLAQAIAWTAGRSN